MAATFAALIEERYRAVVAQKSITDLSTVRGADGTVDVTTGEDEARTTAMCGLIADMIEAELGEVAGSGRVADQASALGVELMNLKYSGVAPLILTPEREAAISAVLGRVRRLAGGLQLEDPGVVSNADKTVHDDQMDKLYPSTDGAGDTSIQSTILNG